MSDIRRVDPRRKTIKTQAGASRIILQPRATEASNPTAERPLRVTGEIVDWLMAVGYSDRAVMPAAFRQAIAAAALLAGPLVGVVAISLGPLDGGAAEAGADAIAVLPDANATNFTPDRDLSGVLALIETFKPRHVLFTESALGDSDLARRLIAVCGGDGATRAVELTSDSVTIAGASGAQLLTRALPKVVVLEPGTVDGNLPFRGQGREVLSEKTRGEASSHYRNLGLELTDAAALALEEADTIVSAGHGVSDIDKIASLAEALGAAVGASRVAVDEGKFPRDKQIGASGKTVSARTYLAVGISGAVQHLQGIKDCGHVIAINTDVGAPITKRADLTIVGDADEVMDALTRRVRAAREQRPEVEA